jgi:hypothetical protein
MGKLEEVKMRVKELIEKLKERDPDAKVCIIKGKITIVEVKEGKQDGG